MRCFFGTRAFNRILDLLKDDGIQRPLERRLEHHEARRFIQSEFPFFVGRGEEAYHGVHVGGGEGAARLVVDNLLRVAVLEEELLKVLPVTHIQPRVGGDETEGALSG